MGIEMRLVPTDRDIDATAEQSRPIVSHATVISYLRSSPLVIATTTEVEHRHTPGEKMRLVWFTDGVWVWSSELVAYVVDRHITLPEELLQRIATTAAPMDIDPQVMQGALTLARSSTPPRVNPAPTRKFHHDATIRRCTDLVVAAGSHNRLEFSSAWEAARDGDVAVGLLGPMLRYSLSALLGAAGATEDASSVIIASSPTFPMSEEVVSAVCAWAVGDHVGIAFEAQTTWFYAAQCIAALQDTEVGDLRLPDLTAVLAEYTA